MNKTEAIKATKNGAIAASISGVLTLAMFLFATFSNASGVIGLWNDPTVIFDVFLIFACAYGIYKKSRFAAVLLFCYFIIAKLYIGIETGKVSGLGIALIFLYFYGKAIQGAFVFHKIEKAENPDYKVTPKWVLYTGIPILTIFIILIGIGLMTTTGVLPSTEVQPGTKVLHSDRDALISNNIILKDDRIEYFYSVGATSIMEGGTVLTDDRVILYYTNAMQKIEIYEIYFNDIVSIELIEMGNTFNDSIYKINSKHPDAWLKIPLSIENRGDVKFIETLREKTKNI